MPGRGLLVRVWVFRQWSLVATLDDFASLGRDNHLGISVAEPHRHALLVPDAVHFRRARGRTESKPLTSGDPIVRAKWLDPHAKKLRTGPCRSGSAWVVQSILKD